MYRPRIIPVLLLRSGGLVKSVKFKNYRYIGDPINAVRIFNDLKADELSLLDIAATKEKRLISLNLVKSIGEEANMPFSVGGGIKLLEDIRKIIMVGAEKVVLNTVAGENPDFIREAALEFGSSTIVVCLDVKKYRGKRCVWIKGGTKATKMSPLEYARRMEELGAGELIIQSIDRDGTMAGYDVALIKEVSERVSIPITALGGAGSLEHMQQLLKSTVVNGLAAGSLFIYHGQRRAVLVNYPDRQEIEKIVS